MTTKKSNFPSLAEIAVDESLRDWFKKEKWVRISSSGNIAGPCGTSKNKKNPDRCLPKAKAQSLTKGERAATARKKKKAGAKGKTVVKNTKKATVKEIDINDPALMKARAAKMKRAKLKQASKPRGISYEDALDLRLLLQDLEDQRADVLRNMEQEAEPEGGPIADDYGDILNNLDKKINNVMDKLDQYDMNETSNPQDGKAAPYGSGYKPTNMKNKNETKGAPKGHYFTKSGNLVKGRLSKDAREKGARLSDPKDKQRSKVPPVTQYNEGTELYDKDGVQFKRFAGPNGVALQITTRKIKGGGFDNIQIEGDKVKEFARAAVHVAQEFHDLKRQTPVNELTMEDVKNLVVGLLHEAQGKEVLMEKDDRCTRIAKRKYDTWPSAYASGAVVRCRRGEIWKGQK